MAAILLIEDDERIAHQLFTTFFSKGHQVVAARWGTKLPALQHIYADLVVCDVDGGDGSDGVHQPWLSAQTVPRPPMLFLTRSGRMLKGLHCYKPAWDDYLTKPFDVTDVESRAEVLLRRYQQWREASNRNSLCAGPLSVDVKRAEARVNGRVIPLTTTEFELLRYLVSNAGEVIPGPRLLRDVWGYRDGTGHLELVRTHIKNLRTKIGFSNLDPFRIIQTVPRCGYIVHKDVASYA